jgi:hypothetical protein
MIRKLGVSFRLGQRAEATTVFSVVQVFIQEYGAFTGCISASSAMADAVIKLKTNKVTGPPARGVGQVWDHWTDFVFDKVNARIESQFQTAMIGKAFQRAAYE